MKYTILLFLTTAVSFSQAQTLELSDFLRNADGSIKFMNHYQASTACPTGMRLPTAREFALIS